MAAAMAAAMAARRWRRRGDGVAINVDGRGRRREEEKTAALCGARIALPLGVMGAVCA
jgi:hypothetical protein